MKTTNHLLFAGMTIAACLFAGCSKSKPSVSGQGTNAPLAAGSGPAVEMKIKWIVGKRYAQELLLSQAGKFAAAGSDRSIEQVTSMKQDFDLDVTKALPNGGVELQLTFLSQKMSTSVNGVTNVQFDSDEKAGEDAKNPVSPILRKLIGSHFLYDLDAAGKVQRIIGLDEFYDQIAGSDTHARAGIKSMMNEDMLKQMVLRGLGLLDKPVRVGQQWPFKMDISAGMVGTLELDLQYTFTGWETHDGKKCAALIYSGTMASKQLAGEQAPVVKMEDGVIEGKSWYDPELQMIVDTTSTQTMTLKSQVKEKTLTSCMKQVASTKVTGVTDLPK